MPNDTVGSGLHQGYIYFARTVIGIDVFTIFSGANTGIETFPLIFVCCAPLLVRRRAKCTPKSANDTKR